ncbi:MAG: BREX-1 system adenine-specific DNA-methyltransferase PglX, partial [Kiritimatiellae bacterium]|nr:BREX-1 system adenine-specific DNA-methyltransferase PglX [Kiritimatiellia bacterium]
MRLCSLAGSQESKKLQEGGIRRGHSWRTGQTLQTKVEKESRMNKNNFFRASAKDFHKIPGEPIAYWLSENGLAVFSHDNLSSFGDARQGLATGCNDRFLREWHEVSLSRIGFHFSNRKDARSSGQKWFPCWKGGTFRRWYGNQELVINWQNDGEEIASYPGSVIRNPTYYFREGLTWSSLAGGLFAMRSAPAGFVFESKGSVFFPKMEEQLLPLLGVMNSLPVDSVLKILAPTLDFHEGPVSRTPISFPEKCDGIKEFVSNLVSLSRTDWDSYETSWDFRENPLVAEARHFGEIMLSDLYDVVRINWAKATVKMRELEIRNNEIFIKAYGLEGELSPDVPWNEVSLTCNPWYRYGREVPENVDAGIYGVASEMPMDADLEKRLRADTAKELVSYAVGCMMGRYSLGRPGLVLADAGGTLEDYRAKLREAGVGAPRFEPDEDGIIPILDADWFEDDVVTRFHAFLRAAFGEASFHANIAWLEDALGKDLRTYFVKDFYADHVQRYQKRPIYWLFSSRKGAFQALVYLHRYRPDTPGRVLGYLRSYIAKVAARIEALDRIAADPSAARGTRTAALRERTKLAKAQAEIADYERDVL